jgi:predicted RNA-binding Zn ribbon-like protein
VPTESPATPPPALETIRSFINTGDLDTGEEHLADPGALVAWLAAHGLRVPGEAPTTADLMRVVQLREALRALAAHNAGEPAPDDDALATLERQRKRSRLGVVFAADGSAPIVPDASGIDAALGELLAIVATAMHDGTWPRLKACADPTCRWAFYDSSRSHRRAWCSMEVCGNRNKVRAYRNRQRADAPSDLGR